MWYVDSVGLVKTPRGLTIDGIQHPRNIFTLWSKAELAAIGIKPASITAVDSRYKNTGELTWNTDGEEAVGTYATTEKAVADLKIEMKRTVNDYASSVLSQSDWMTIRAADGGIAVPSAWVTYRTAVRTTVNAKETEIDALADLDAVKAYEKHPVTITLSSGASNTTVNKVTWISEGGHADSWPTSPDYPADPDFVSVVDA